MKKLVITSILLAMFVTFSTITAQDRQEEYLGLPGDNLNLYAVMKLFQESETLEGFEKTLNDQNSRINNLDLNGDNYVDYIKVIDYVNRDVHNIVLQVALDQKENQDVAVFTVQQFENGQVQIQLTGDEELYGRNYIIEPIFDEAVAGETPNPGYMGNATVINGQSVTIVRTTPVVIATWPLVRYIYQPSYIPWHSTWYWSYYPSYWHPWKPFYWHYYYGYHYNWYKDYYSHYRHYNNHRYTNYHDFYYSSRRSYSPTVNIKIKSGSYKTTYSHPEQRRKGEALYTKDYSSRRVTTATRTSTNSQVRTNRSGTTRTSPATRRTTTTVVNNRSTVNKSNSGQSGEKVRGSSTNVTKRSTGNTKSVQNAEKTRRSSAESVNRPVAKTSSATKAASTRSSGKQTTATAKTSRSSSSSSNKKESAQKKSSKAKESEAKKTTRR